MSLSEIAIEAYRKKKAEQDKNYKEDADDFCESALEALKEQFGDYIDISKVGIVEEHPGYTTVMIGNEITIIITKFQGYHHFKMIKKCEKCGEDYSEDVRHIEDIGKFLSEEHDKIECDNNLRIKEGMKEPTTEKKLISALRDFIYELQEQ